MQNLYAFYVCKQANYECALDQIRLDFTPDVFAELPVDKEQLAKGQAQALSWFQAYFEKQKTAELTSYGGQVQAAVERARLNYTNEVGKDLQRLQNSWTVAVDKILQACLYVLQLLIEWTSIAHRQAERPRLSQQHGPYKVIGLVHSHIIPCLSSHASFTQLVHKSAVSWSDKPDLVLSWYNHFIKGNPTLQHDAEQGMTLAQDRELLVYLAQSIILSQEAIQEFFSDLDLSWAVHKQAVKRIVTQTLRAFEENTAKDANLKILESPTVWEEGEHFYTDLVNKTLEQDEALEELIKQYIENWTINRIVLLDKTILKLAMCEMRHFTNIPIKVSINEYIDLSKAYSTPKSSQFINGILDAMAKTR